MPRQVSQKQRRKRRGTAAVEFAMIAPLLFLVTLAIF